MPLNTSAIIPSDEITGTVSLPLARVKKTIAADEDIGPVSAQATFIIAKAAELFIQYATERSWDMAKTETRPKKSLTYTHVANAVARTDNLEFLSDIVPQTTTLRAHRARKEQEAAASAEAAVRKSRVPIDPKQTTLSSADGPSTSDVMEISGQELPILSHNGGSMNSTHAAPPAKDGEDANGTNLVFQHYAPNGTSNRSGPRNDVDML